MSTTFKTGQRMHLAYNGQAIEARVLLASSNGKSLMLNFVGTLRTPSGGLMIATMPLLMDDDGVYRDLAESAPATLRLL